MAIRLVITDLDNTLYPWTDFIIPAMEAMIDSLVATTGKPRVAVVQALKAVYERFGTNEYAFAIQQSRLFEDYRSDFASFRALVIEPAREAFSQMRRRYLRLYPSVFESLVLLRKQGQKVVALTDAPRNPAESRVKQLGLDAQLDALYTLPGYALPYGVVDQAIVDQHEQGEYHANLRVVELPANCEKPSPRGLQRIMADYGIPPQETVMVGDNLAKDVGAALAAGVTPIWAEYGTYIPQFFRDRLEVFNAPSAIRRQLGSADYSLPAPEIRISSFSLVPRVVNDLK